MSKENVDALREAIDAYNRHDLGGFLGLMHDDVEARPRRAGDTFPDASRE
jgi:hypothetical protein